MEPSLPEQASRQQLQERGSEDHNRLLSPAPSTVVSPSAASSASFTSTASSSSTSSPIGTSPSHARQSSPSPPLGSAAEASSLASSPQSSPSLTASSSPSLSASESPSAESSSLAALTGGDEEREAMGGGSNRVIRACSNCKKAKARCDQQRPCIRCVRTGKQDSCVDSVHAKRGRKQQTRADSPGGNDSGSAQKPKMPHSMPLSPDMALMQAVPLTAVPPPLIMQQTQTQQQTHMLHMQQTMQVPQLGIGMHGGASVQQLFEMQQVQQQQQQHLLRAQQQQQQQQQAGLAASQQQQHPAFAPLSVAPQQPPMHSAWQWMHQQQLQQTQAQAQAGLSMYPPFSSVPSPFATPSVPMHHLLQQHHSPPSTAASPLLPQFALQSSPQSASPGQLLSAPAYFNPFNTPPRSTLSSPGMAPSLLQSSGSINRVLSSPAAVYQPYPQQSQQQSTPSVSPPSTLSSPLYPSAATPTTQQQPHLSPMPLPFMAPPLLPAHMQHSSHQLPAFLAQLAPLPSGVASSPAAAQSTAGMALSNMSPLGTVPLMQQQLQPQQAALQGQLQAQFPLPPHPHPHPHPQALYSPSGPLLPTPPFRAAPSNPPP